MAANKLVTFIEYHGSKDARYFLDLPAWAAGEARVLSADVAKLLQEKHGDATFTVEAVTKPEKSTTDEPTASAGA